MVFEHSEESKRKEPVGSASSERAPNETSDNLSSQAWHWTDNNVVRPVVNDLLVQPYSAVRNVVNFVASPITTDLLPKVEHLHTEKPTDWAGTIAQNVSGGLASTLAIVTTGRLGGGFFKTVGRTEYAGTLTGIGTYEALRDPNQQMGETRLSNVLGTVGAVGAFGKVYSLTGAESGLGRMGARFVAGSVAMPAGMVLGDAAQGRLATTDDLINASVFGGVMSAALPFGGRSRSVNTDVVRTGAPVVEAPAEAIARSNVALPELPAPRNQRLSYMVGDNEAGPFKTFEDFEGRGQLISSPMMRMFDVPRFPATKIAIPEAAPNYARITPEQAYSLMRATPDAGLFSKLTILDKPHPMEPWYRQNVDPTWRVKAETGADGEVRMYRPAVGEDLGTTTNHEWNHLLKLRSPEASAAFDRVGSLERFSTSSRSMTETSNGEQWSMLGEDLLSRDANLVGVVTLENPIRSSIWGQALENRLAALSPEQQSSQHTAYESIARFIRGQARPMAVERLQEMSRAGDAEVSARARDLLRFLGS